MHGSYSSGRFTIVFDANSERLEAPPAATGRRHYLPCSECGEVAAVAWNIVSWACAKCQAAPRSMAHEVDRVFRDCLFYEGEPTDAAVMAPSVVLGGFGFHPDRLESHRAQVEQWLRALPKQFRAGEGGGWSFLNGCMLESGEQWGEHRNVDQLFALGIALKLVDRSPPELDHVMPGGVPYYTVKVPPPASDTVSTGAKS